MDHSRLLNTNMDRKCDEFEKMLFNDDKIEKSFASFELCTRTFSTSTPAPIRRYEEPSSTDVDSMHFRNSDTLSAIPYSPLQPSDISPFWSDNKNSLGISLENAPLSFNQLQKNASIQPFDGLVPIERFQNTVPFQNEPQRIMENDMSWMMSERELSSFGDDRTNGIFGYQTYHAPGLAYQKPKAELVLPNEMSANGKHLRENNGKRIPIAGRLKAYKSGPAKSFSKFSLYDATDCDDAELDPSINARAIGLCPPPKNDWDHIITEMQLCVQYLNQLSSQRGIEKLLYKLEMLNQYSKLNSHWLRLDKFIHTEYKSSFLFVRDLQHRCQTEKVNIFMDYRVVFQQFDAAASEFEKTRDFSILKVSANSVMIYRGEIAQFIATIKQLTSSVRVTANYAFSLQTLLLLHENEPNSEHLADEPLAEPAIPGAIGPVGYSPRSQKYRHIG